MRRTAFLTAVASLLCACLWIVFAQADIAPPSSAQGLGTDIETASGNAATQSIANIDDSTPVALQTSDAGTQRDEVETNSAETRKHLQVTVVDDVTDEAIADAEFSYENIELDFDTLTGADLAFFEANGKQRNADAVLDRFGIHTRTDANGQVLVPIAARSMYLRGRHENRYGKTSLDPRRTAPERGWQVRLARDINFDVLVQDSRGEPLSGISIGIRIDYDRGGISKKAERRSAFTKFGAPSSPTGMVEVRHLQSVLKRYQRSKKSASTIVATRIAANLPGLTWNGVTFNLDSPPTEALVLRLPGMGSIKLLLQDAQGTPIRASAWVRITPQQVETGGRKGTTSHWSETGDNGEKVYPHIALGQTFEARVSLRNEQAKQVIIGPSSPGQEVTEVITIGSERAYISGRVLSETGQPIPDTKLSVSIMVDGRNKEVQCQADSKGEFLAILSPSTLDKTATSIEVFKLRDQRSKSSTSSGLIETKLVLSRGPHNIGDIRLLPAPFLVGGRLLGDSDTKLKRVQLTIESHRPAAADGSEDERWIREDRYELERGENGTFAFHAQLQSQRLRLKASSRDHAFVEPIEFQVGDEDIEVHFDRGTSFDVEVLTDSFVKQDDLRLALFPAGTIEAGVFIPFKERGTGRSVPLGSAPGHLHYHWENIGSASYDVVARIYGTPEPLAVLRGITLPYTQEPIEIDLRGKLHRFTVTALGEGGKPASSGAVVATSGFGDNDMEGFDLSRGQAEIITANPTIDLMVVCRGYLPTAVLGASSDTQVNLRRAPNYPIRFEFTGIDKLPKDTRLLLTLKGHEKHELGGITGYFTMKRRSRRSLQGWGQAQYRSNRTFSSGPVKLTVLWPGSYEPKLYYLPGGRAWHLLQDLKPETIEVIDQPAEQTFRIEVPATSWPEPAAGKTERK